MKILAIDPSSNKIETSTTGVVLLDNARLVDSWVVSYGMRGFADWFHEIGTNLEFDVVIVEEFKARDNDKSKDNSVAETIALGFGDEGGRNDKLAKFVGGLLYRAVDDGVVVQLARLANANSPNPLPEKEMMRTIESMIKKDRR